MQTPVRRKTRAMTYAVKEIFYTLQGEGRHAGRPAVFVRFAGCNLWNGREQDRANAVCNFCDTDFVGTDGMGGGKFADADALADATAAAWPEDHDGPKFAVLTGGEPLLQVNTVLIDALHGAGFEIAVETNGTVKAPDGIDWLCVSPKADAPLKQLTGHELKLVYPQQKARPEMFEGLAFSCFSLQPLDGPNAEANTQACIAYCKSHPAWRLSLQTHKVLGIP